MLRMSNYAHWPYLYQTELSLHWHCDQCLDRTFTASNAEARAKHVELWHTDIHCDCGATYTLASVPQHVQHACPLRRAMCRFCHNYVVAGAPARDHGDHLRGFTQHEVCWVAASYHPSCNQYSIIIIILPRASHTHRATVAAAPRRATYARLPCGSRTPSTTRGCTSWAWLTVGLVLLGRVNLTPLARRGTTPPLASGHVATPPPGDATHRAAASHDLPVRQSTAAVDPHAQFGPVPAGLAMLVSVPCLTSKASLRPLCHRARPHSPCV